MRFMKKMTWLSIAPPLALLGAALVGVLGIRHAEQRFDEIFSTAHPLSRSATDMYGHGLQMGQALRNIVLDPANPTAYKNLESAQKAYDEAAETAHRLAAGTPLRATLEQVA